MEKQSAISILSIVPIRANASHSSEMVSQILFGEVFYILERKGDWLSIETDYDHYKGWIDEKQAFILDSDIQDINQFVTQDLITSIIKTNSEEIVYVPAGSSLPFYNEGKCLIGKSRFDINSSNIINTKNSLIDIVEAAKNFLNAPYLWGGRTHFGIDCSGFSQIVFKMCGIKINRDASQQAEQGVLVDFLSEAKAGDLAFFDNEVGRITHVGIMLNNHQIIHASGRVKIDSIDNQGIFSNDLKRYSHKLRIIKRFI